MEVGQQGFIGPIRESYTSVVSDLMKKTSRDEARIVLVALEKISARSKDVGIIENCPRPWRTLLKSLRSGKAQDARSIISLIEKELGKKTEKKPAPRGVLGPQTKQAKKGNAPQPASPKARVKQKQGAKPIPSKIDEGLQERFEALRRRDRPTEELSLSEIDTRLEERFGALRHRDLPIDVEQKEEERSLSEIEEELQDRFLKLSEKEFQAEMKRGEKEFQDEMKRVTGQIPTAQTWNIKGWVVGGAVSLAVGSLAFFGLPTVGAAPVAAAGAAVFAASFLAAAATKVFSSSRKSRP